jgi:hypothetical protein
LRALLISQFLSPCVPSLGSLWIVTHAEDFLANSDEIADAKLLSGSRIDARWVVPVARLPRHTPSLSVSRDGPGEAMESSRKLWCNSSPIIEVAEASKIESWVALDPPLSDSRAGKSAGSVRVVEATGHLKLRCAAPARR